MANGIIFRPGVAVTHTKPAGGEKTVPPDPAPVNNTPPDPSGKTPPMPIDPATLFGNPYKLDHRG